MTDRASVMEYPSPRIKVVGGKIDLTDAYQKQIGAYDIMTVRYAYTVFPAGQEKAGLDNIIKDMRKQGLTFTPATDPDGTAMTMGRTRPSICGRPRSSARSCWPITDLPF